MKANMKHQGQFKTCTVQNELSQETKHVVQEITNV